MNPFITLESGWAESYKMPTTTGRDDGYVPDATPLGDAYVHTLWPECMAELVQKEENYAIVGYEEHDAMVDVEEIAINL